MGVYGSSTFYQGEPVTPDPHTAPPSSQCTPVSSVGRVLAANYSIQSSGPSGAYADLGYLVWLIIGS